jgi:hypothetical protein
VSAPKPGGTRSSRRPRRRCGRRRRRSWRDRRPIWAQGGQLVAEVVQDWVAVSVRGDRDEDVIGLFERVTSSFAPCEQDLGKGRQRCSAPANPSPSRCAVTLSSKGGEGRSAPLSKTSGATPSRSISSSLPHAASSPRPRPAAAAAARRQPVPNSQAQIRKPAFRPASAWPGRRGGRAGGPPRSQR